MPRLATCRSRSELGEHAGLPQHPYRWRAATAHLRRATGDLDQALELLVEAERVYDTDFSPAVRPDRGRRRTRAARPRRARLGRPLGERTWPHRRRRCRVRPRVRAHHPCPDPARPTSGRTADAIRLLERLLAAAESGRRDGTVIEILVLLALAHEARGDRDAATAALERALVRAEPEGYHPALPRRRPGAHELLRLVALTRRRPHATPNACSPPRRRCADDDHAVHDCGATSPRRRAQQPRTRRAAAPAQRPERTRHRSRAARVAEHGAHPHQEHLHQARRHQPARSDHRAAPTEHGL